jgi:hypothetical protein
MTELNNASPLAVEIGRKAATAWNEASKYGDGGDALATHALYIASRETVFEAQVNRGSKAEPEIETESFTLSEVATEPRNNDGSVDGKLKSARTVAIAQHVFGVAELDNAFKQRQARAIKLAMYLANMYRDDDDETYYNRVSTKTMQVARATGKTMTTCLVVPREALVAAPAEDADDIEKENYNNRRNEKTPLNGKDKASLAELSRRANPPKAAIKGSDERNDKGASFIASLDFVSAIVLQNANPEADESEVGLGNDARRKLFTLAQNIAAYFAIDPLEDDSDEEEQVAA